MSFFAQHHQRPPLRFASAPTCLQLLCLLLLLCLPPASANQEIAAAAPGMVESGTPSFVFFAPETIGLESPASDLRELPDGRIIVVAQREFAVGDGVRWEVYHRAYDQHGQTLSSIAVGADGKLYCGIRDGFARLDFNPNGHWRYTRVAQVPDSPQNLGTLFSSAHLLDGHWYWHTESGAVLRWDLQGTATNIIKVDTIECLFSINKKLYVSDLSKGSLFSIHDSAEKASVEEVALGKGALVTASAPFGQNKLLVGTLSKGVQIFDGNTFTPFAKDEVLSGPRRINDLCATEGNFFAAAVDTYGLVFFDADGRIVQILDRRMDQRLARVQKLHKSREGVIWALCNESIARIEFPSRLSHFEQLLDTGISHVEPVRFEGKLWFLASGHVLEGIYNENRRLTELADISPKGTYTFTLKACGKKLLAGTEKGLFEYRNSTWEALVPSLSNARILCQDPNGSERWLYASAGQLGWLDFRSKDFTHISIPKPDIPESYNAAQDAAGFIWLEHGSGKVSRLDPRSPDLRWDLFTRTNGIPDAWAAVYMIDGTVRINCAGRQLCFNQKSNTWEDDLALLRRYPALASTAGRPTIDARNRLWISGPDKVRIFSANQARELESLSSEFHPYNFICEDKGVVWMHDKHRIARYDPEIPKTSTQPIRAVITQIDLIVSGRTVINPPDRIAELPASDNSLIAHFLAPGNPFGQHLTFDIKLEGSMDEWSSTGVIGSAIFNHLKPGPYTLHVRPRIGDSIGEEAVLHFEITPPWYHSPLAYAAAMVLGLTLISLLIFLPIRNERLQQTKLKALVAVRTRELKETNQQLTLLVDETRLKAAALKESEDRYRRLSTELEQRVTERTEELRRRIEEVENLNKDLQQSHAETERAAARLQEVNANLLVANHELESFSYSVSHDLRAPLRNITGFMELLGKRVRSLQEKESDRYLDIVVSEARRMASLIDDLLTFSRVGRTEMKLQEVNLEELIQAAQREMAEDFRGRDIEWRIAKLPPVMGDRALLRQVIINLLSNAVKFTRRENKALIEIGTTPMLENSNMASFYVRDNGVGFNPRYMDKLFRVFQRLHTPRDFEGTGIGLANVKRIITRHNGRIWAEGAVNGGATFHFTLRLMPRTNEPMQISVSEDPASP